MSQASSRHLDVVDSTARVGDVRRATGANRCVDGPFRYGDLGVAVTDRELAAVAAALIV
jgi:hypothetical protein